MTDGKEGKLQIVQRDTSQYVKKVLSKHKSSALLLRQHAKSQDTEQACPVIDRIQNIKEEIISRKGFRGKRVRGQRRR